jgi:hypothetical protein
MLLGQDQAAELTNQKPAEIIRDEGNGKKAAGGPDSWA